MTTTNLNKLTDLPIKRTVHAGGGKNKKPPEGGL
jgi:hypothetical protein